MSKQHATIRGIMQACSAPVDVSLFQKTNEPNIYLTPNALMPMCYYDGFHLFELWPKELGHFEDQLKQIKNSVEQFNKQIAKGHWEYVFTLMNKKIVWQSFFNKFNEIPVEKRYEIFIDIYTSQDFGFELLADHYSNIFSYAKYSEERLERLQTLALQYGDEPITIYHGESLTYPVYDHYSWTLKKEVAEFFAKRHHGLGEIWIMEVNIMDCIDYLTGRNEEEIIYPYTKELLTFKIKREVCDGRK